MHCLVSLDVLVCADAGGCVTGSEGVRAVYICTCWLEFPGHSLLYIYVHVRGSLV